MSVAQQVARFGGRRIVGRCSRWMPWVGAALALAAFGSTVRRKGFVGGTLDTALNAIPVVGGIKNTAEMLRGRDFIRERPSTGRSSSLRAK